jgi:hypothetical protein
VSNPTTLTTSKDVTIPIAQMLPHDQQAQDFGHVDLVATKDAENLFGSRLSTGSTLILEIQHASMF